MTHCHPQFDRLTAALAQPPLDAEGLAAFCAAPGEAVILCAGDPVRYPEALDLAAILPELLRAFPGRLRAALADAEVEPTLGERYAIARWPSLVFLRDGEHLGTIAGVQDWGVYLARITGLLDAPAAHSVH